MYVVGMRENESMLQVHRFKRNCTVFNITFDLLGKGIWAIRKSEYKWSVEHTREARVKMLRSCDW